MKKFFIAITLSLVVAACSTGDKGAAIGSGTDDYKSSPCACNQIPQKGLLQYKG